MKNSVPVNRTSSSKRAGTTKAKETISKKSNKSSYKWVDELFDRFASSKERRIIARLQKYTEYCELPLYAEIEEQIDEAEYPNGRAMVLRCMLNMALISENKNDMKNGKNGLKDLNADQKKIARTAEKLASLIDKRDRLLNPDHVTSKAIVKPIDLYVKAGIDMCPAERRISFKRQTLLLLKEYLYEKHSGTAEPKLAEVFRTLSQQMKENPVEPANPLIKKIHRYRKYTPVRDFVRAFSEALNVSSFYGDIPRNFHLTLHAFATTAGAALDISRVTEDDVRRALKSSRR